MSPGQSIVVIAIVIAYLMAITFALFTIILIPVYLRRQSWRDGDVSEFNWHFLVPCRDEEAVVGDTVTYLLEHFPTANIWVIDDDSDDATRDIVRSYMSPNNALHLVERKRPNARLGKSQALNYAWARIKEKVEAEGGDYRKEIIIVVDADGRPSPNFLDVLAGPGCFGNEETSLVQAEVRMRNRTDRRPIPDGDWLMQGLGRLFIRMQDIEFRGPISATQMLRRFTRTVNAGGNGQAARASALTTVNLGDGPWGESLVEDLELGLHILFAGGQNAYTTDAYVDQEALHSLSRFLVQRARWSRGTMQCTEYVPNVWKTPQITNLGVLETTFFLMQPWNQLLGSLAFPIPIFVFFYAMAKQPDMIASFAESGGWWILGIILLIAVLEFSVWGVLYTLRCERDKSWLQGALWGIAYMFYVFLNYPIVWRAFSQLVSGRQGWAKTKRNAEIAQSARATVARFD